MQQKDRITGVRRTTSKHINVRQTINKRKNACVFGRSETRHEGQRKKEKNKRNNKRERDTPSHTVITGTCQTVRRRSCALIPLHSKTRRQFTMLVCLYRPG